MTAREFSNFQLQSTAKMVDIVLSAFDEDTQLAQSHPEAMSVRDMMIHLADCYCAVTTEGEYAWGSFEPASSSYAGLIEEMKSLRAKAFAAVDSDDDAALKKAFEYLVHHDQYHLGQLVTAALSVNPGWDHYSIYA